MGGKNRGSKMRDFTEDNAYKITKQEFQEFYKQYWRLAYYEAYKITHDVTIMEDILQEIFISALRNIDKLREESNVAAWIATIARNHAKNALKKKYNRRKWILEMDDEEISTVADSQPELEDVIISKETIDGIFRAILSMDEKYAYILLLKYKFSYSPQQISDELELKLKTVHTRIRRGENLLRKKLCELEEQAQRTVIHNG